MAVTEQEFIDLYKWLSAEKQQAIYNNSWNAQVRWWIDSYNASQNSVPQQNVTPNNIVNANNNGGNNTNTVNNDTVKPKNQNVNQNADRTSFSYTDADYYTLGSQARQDDIVSNLNNYKQTNPEYFSNYETFKNSFSYNDRSDVQKQTLDTWYKGYQRWLELNSKAVSDLATQYKNWLLSDSDLEQLRATNNWKYAEVMQYVNKQAVLSKYDEEANIASSDNPFQAIIDQYYANLLTASKTNATSEMFNNYKSQMNSPEMTEMSDQLADLDGQIKEYQTELNRIKSDVERRYEWTWASKAKINAIISDESYKIQEAMNTANIQYNTLANKYNSRMSQYQNEFQLELQEYQFNMQQRNQQMQELWFVMDLMNFETNAQKDEREWNNYIRQYDYQYWNINSKDYASRRKAVDNAVQDVLNEFSGITMRRSKDQMVEDIMNLVDGWMSLWEAITKNIREPIMQKDEYQLWKSNKYWSGTISIGWSNYSFDSNGNLILNKPKTYTWPSYTAVSTETMNDALKQVQSLWNGSWWWQCGSFVNNYLQDMWIGRLYTDPIEAKKAVTNTDTPTIWSVAVIDRSNNPNASEAQKQYGHVWIVVGIDWDKITLKQSNKNWNEQIFTSTYDKSQIYGYFDPTLEQSQAYASQTQNNWYQLSEVDEAKKQNYLEEARRWRISQTNTVQIWDLAAEQWWADERRQALNQWLNVDLTDTQIKRMDTADNTFKNNSLVKDFEDAAAQINILTSALKANNWVWDLAAIFTFMKVLDPTSVVREWEFKSAAQTAWYLNPDALWQQYVKHWWDWTRLTEAQSGNFAALAKEIIKSRAELYQVKYNDLLRAYNNYWISSDLAPTNMADAVLESLWATTPKYDFSSLNTSNITKTVTVWGNQYTW